jgi:hypothetical protein
MLGLHARGCGACWRAQAALGLQKPGPELGRAMAAAVDWQVVHPTATAAQCAEYVKQWWAKEQAR